jgi:hypothetical protein
MAKRSRQDAKAQAQFKRAIVPGRTAISALTPVQSEILPPSSAKVSAEAARRFRRSAAPGTTFAGPEMAIVLTAEVVPSQPDAAADLKVEGVLKVASSTRE